MKKVIIFISIVCLNALLFVSCRSDNGEDTVRNFITAFYTINQSDLDYYQRSVNGVSESEYSTYLKSYETNTKKFEEYLSARSYQHFYTDRMSVGRLKNAYNKGNLVEIKDLKLTKSEEDKKEKTISYRYELQLNIINKDTKKTITSNKNGTFIVGKENNQWKILNYIEKSML